MERKRSRGADDQRRSADRLPGPESQSSLFEGEYEAIFETTGDALFVFDVHHDGADLTFTFRRNNRVHETRTGITTEGDRGAAVDEIFGTDGAAVVESRFRNCVETGERIEYDEVVEYPSGPVAWHTTLTPVFDEGEVQRLVGVARDGGEHEHTQAVFEQAEAMEMSMDGMAILDANGEYVYMNQAHADVYGYDGPDALIGRHWQHLYDEDEVARFEEEIMPALADDGEWRGEATGIRADGTTFPQELSLTSLDDGSLVCVVRDISERKEMEKTLRQRETRLRTMFTHHSAPMLLIDPDSGAIVETNEAATEFYGYTEAQLTSMRIDEINSMTPDEVEAERRRAEREDRTHFVFDHELASGEVRTVEVHSSPVEANDTELLFSIVHDVTERKEYERELERYKELVDNVPVGIYRNTPGASGEFIEVNPAIVEMFDADSPAELRDHSVSDLYADPEERRSFAETVQAEEIVREAELQLETLSGDAFWGSVTAIKNDTEAGTYFDGVILDITDRVEFERRLKEQRNGLEVLNKVVRHDIRNDLQLVLAYVELLDGKVDEDGQEYVETALESAKNAVDLTKRARDLAEVMLQTDTEHEAIDLTQILEQQVDEIRSSHTESVVTLERALPDVRVRADTMLQSVFRNLLQNAIKHNDKPVPEVTVSVTKRDDDVVVRIADNGPGIPDAQRPEIFGEGEKGLESSGTGIGLYLVNTLVTQYGGDVWITENQPDGTVFNVTLEKVE